MTRVAAVDCGTNSIRLLIADVDYADVDIADDDAAGVDAAAAGAGGGPPRLTDVVREMRVVRLGQGVDATGEFAREALDRTFAATREYAGLIRRHGATKVRFVATSATRDARNREVFIDGIRELLGVEPEVISGDEEAALSFAGASSVLPSRGPDPVLVVDLGGGSTEFVLGNADGVIAAKSVDIGCVRMTERHLRNDPPTAEQIAAAEADIDAAISEAARTVPLDRSTVVVGVAGSVTTITAHALDLPEYSPAAIHGTELSLAAVRRACTGLLEMTRAERAALPYMHPGRVDVIGAGGLVWRRVLERLAEATEGRIPTAVSSEHDILDGIALSIS
ncbi:exopolyphosphatase/guanosine-5'-triphosphate,3'-diphosphate pyrophosphatase [Arthrobacter sp. V4I6]|uniref:Ppx/GppA phosphatase family protein n=1 Tax=unclassified Arthrobacter TaxID=235627 RepID=UPI0027861710|nr:MULTISPECIES: Ppx/GppA phosphatase family protein [unclassified Arthrobacter]MDQ0822180.1 exopolyphosphatase/guanosine-5'-triphosphate,3'-diphosphate pyrophosphatase [Arthrobacter sp. V1I7]MDQ0856448.1 exopolyphosphatase/guanosine-5'-triphosphate,3'-diphosphate pyrophosphatase [Arthrobacter sp. V4I6]